MQAKVSDRGAGVPGAGRGVEVAAAGDPEAGTAAARDPGAGTAAAGDPGAGTVAAGGRRSRGRRSVTEQARRAQIVTAAIAVIAEGGYGRASFARVGAGGGRAR